MKNNWKVVGLWVAVVLELLFLVLYLSSLLVSIGSDVFADILWLGGGILGIVFGSLNWFEGRRRFLAGAAGVMGVFLLFLWAMAAFIVAM